MVLTMGVHFTPQASIFTVRAADDAAAAGLLLLFSQQVAFNALWVACWILLALSLIQEVSILGLELYPNVSGDEMLARMLQHLQAAQSTKAATTNEP
jgi:hypothetical protein